MDPAQLIIISLKDNRYLYSYIESYNWCMIYGHFVVIQVQGWAGSVS